MKKFLGGIFTALIGVMMCDHYYKKGYNKAMNEDKENSKESVETEGEES